MLIAIDGACRRNGKPDCVSAGGIFVTDLYGHNCYTASKAEMQSTNQRGELNALILALTYIVDTDERSPQIITDSEYLFNAMDKEWVHKWFANNWTLSSGEPVKNADLWKKVHGLLCAASDAEISYYHIKGHVIPFGAVTAHKLLLFDNSGAELYKEALSKFDAIKNAKRDNICRAQDLSKRNNGFELTSATMRRFVAMNVVVDAVATEAVNAADCNG